MQTRKYTTLRIILTALPMAVLLTLFGLWVFFSPPGFVESALMSALILGLFVALGIRYVPQLMDWFRPSSADLLPRTENSRTNRAFRLREILAVALALLVFRALVALLAFGLHYHIYGYTGTFFTAQRLWATYGDAAHYLSIASRGYVSEAAATNMEHLRLVFLPFYSYVVWFFSLFTSNLVRAGFYVSNLATILGGVVLYRLVLFDYDRGVARRAVRYYCIVPIAFILSSIMSDGLFFFLSVSCLYAARKKNFMLAVFFGAIAAYTRLLGLVVLVPLVMEYVKNIQEARREHRADGWKFALMQSLYGLSLLLVPLAFVLYLFQCYLISGNFFQAFVYQDQNWAQHFQVFFITPAVQTDYLINAVLDGTITDVFGLWLPNLLAISLSLTLILSSHKKMRASYVAYFICYFFMSVSASWLLSAPRYLFCCFPLLIALALLTKKKWVDWTVSIASLVCFVLYFYMFLARYQVY